MDVHGFFKNRYFSTAINFDSKGVERKFYKRKRWYCVKTGENQDAYAIFNYPKGRLFYFAVYTLEG